MKKLIVSGLIGFTGIIAFSCGGGNSNSATPAESAGKIISDIICALADIYNNISHRIPISECAGSSNIARTSSPTRVVPGSRTASTANPADSSALFSS